MENKRYTSYCGLYCADCIPSNKAFFETLATLHRMLSEQKFDRYAEYKARGNPVFAAYPQFTEVLQAIRGLECKALCCDGGSKQGCLVRECVVKKEFRGCWECGYFKNCNLLIPMKVNHEDLEHNQTMIKQHGLNQWMSRRGKHYSWGERSSCSVIQE